MDKRHGFSDRPSITLKWAQTIDGQLADDCDQSQWISGPEERKYTHAVRARHDAVLVGAQTFLKDRCQLTVRETAVKTQQPVRVILDPRGRLAEAVLRDPHWLKVLAEGNRRTYILTDVLPESFIPVMQSSVQWMQYRLENLNQWLDAIIYLFARRFEKLEERRLSSIMVEGGAATLALFLKTKRADHLEIAISPLILGGKKHRVETQNLLSNVHRFSFESQERFGADIILRYSSPSERSIA